ncbi:MAG: DciA family protein [Elusimicrobia bacterium]|nr:DciA family protein [Elusimicrobiota bacterium]
MFLTRRSSNWTRASEIKSSWKFLGGIDPDRLVILDAVWKKEIGRLAQHCRLLGVNRGWVLVKADSSVMSNELLLRSRQLVRSLNRYFRRPWIKGIKTANEI